MKDKVYDFICCRCTFVFSIWQERVDMAHIGFLHALKGLQPNKQYELSSQQLWNLVKTAGIKLKPSQKQTENIKKFKNAKNYKDYVNSNICGVIKGTENRAQDRAGQIEQEKMEEQNFQYSCQTAFRKKKKQFQESLPKFWQEIGEQAICPICLQILVLPMLTICGHAFCYQCIDEHFLFSSACPNCREDNKQVKFKIDVTLDKLIQDLLQNCQDEAITTAYQLRLKKTMAWRRQRELNPMTLKRGGKLDIRDTELIWCSGQIKDIYYQNNQVEGVLIHYIQWHKLYDEVIYLPNIRLAPPGYFTNRNDISCYKLSQPENNMRGLVTTAQNRAIVQAAANDAQQIEPQDQDDDESSQNNSDDEDAAQPYEQPQQEAPQQQQQNAFIFQRIIPNFGLMGIRTQPRYFLYPHGFSFFPMSMNFAIDQQSEQSTQVNRERQSQNGDEDSQMEVEEDERNQESQN